MKISENTEFKIDIKTVIGIIMLTTTFVGMYYTLQEDIAEAKELPPVEVGRLEYELKEKWNHENIEDILERVNMLEQVDDVIFEEINVLSSLVKDGTESDGKLQELQKRLEELNKRKPTIIVKQVEVKKRR
jgi:ACT domain-containing protein